MNLIFAENKQSVNGAIGTGLVNSTIPTDLVKGDSSTALTDKAVKKYPPRKSKTSGLNEPEKIFIEFLADRFFEFDHEDLTAQGENPIAIGNLLIHSGIDEVEVRDHWLGTHPMKISLPSFIPHNLQTLNRQTFEPETEWDELMGEIVQAWINLGVEISNEDARSLLKKVVPACKDTVEFDDVCERVKKMLGQKDFKNWQNTIKPFHQLLTNRLWDEKKPKNSADLDPEDLKIKIKAFLEEKDQAKREVILYEFRKMGLGEKAVYRIAAQLAQNGTTPLATRLSASDFRSRVNGGKKWLVPGLIPQVGVSLLTGLSGGGKSTFAFDLAGSIICGTSFMGETVENGSVVFACSDEPTDESQERALLQGFFHYDDFEFLEQWNIAQMEMLEEAIADQRPKLVVVDSFDSIHREAGHDENAIQASETIKKFNTLSQKYSCAFLVLHHENKDPRLSGVNKARGHSSIVASANAHISIIGKDDNPEAKYVKIEKLRGGATRSILCSVDYHNIRFEPEVNLEFEQDKDGRTALLNFLSSNSARWFEVQELNHYLGWSGKGIYRYLKQLCDRGEIGRKPNTMGRKGMVYSVGCTNGDNPEINLSPPSLVKTVSQEKIISETIDTQGIEVSHILVTSQSHLVTSQSHVTISEEPENLTLSDSHTCDQEIGEIEGGGVNFRNCTTRTRTR
jgi:hypothetical protein